MPPRVTLNPAVWTVFATVPVDERGIPLTDAERAFRTEDAALNDAVERLNGVSLVV